MPRSLQILFVQLGWANESWITEEYRGLPPEWAQWGDFLRGLGYFAPAAKALPWLGEFPLAGTLAPSYAYGMFETAYRAGWGPFAGAPFGGEDWTYAGRFQYTQELMLYHSLRAAGAAAWGYEPTRFRIGMEQLSLARMAYWETRQEMAPMNFGWGATRLASYLSPEAGIVRAYGWAFQGPIQRGMLGQAMMPYMRAAYATGDPWVLRQITDNPAFWPFQTQTWQQALSQGVFEWTAVQMGAMGLKAFIRPGLETQFIGYGQGGVDVFGPQGMYPMFAGADRPRLQAAWEAIKPAVPVGLMQAGLGLMVDPLMTASLVYRMTRGKQFFLTEQQMQSFIAQEAVGAGLFGTGVYLGYGRGWIKPTAGTGAVGYLSMQLLAMQGLTAASMILENLVAPMWPEIFENPEWQQMRQTQLETYGAVMSIFDAPSRALAMPVASFLDILGFKGAAEAMRTRAGAQGGIIDVNRTLDAYRAAMIRAGYPDQIADQITAMVARSPQYVRETIAKGQGAVAYVPGLTESIVWQQLRIGPRLGAWFGGLGQVGALAYGTLGLWGGRAGFDVLNALWGATGPFLQGLFGEAATLAAELGAPRAAQRFSVESILANLTVRPGDWYATYDWMVSEEYQRMIRMSKDPWLEYDWMVSEEYQKEKQTFLAQQAKLGGAVWQGYWDIFGASPWLKGMRYGTIMEQITQGLTREQLYAMFANNPDMLKVLNALYASGKLPAGTTDIFAAAGLNMQYGWGGMGQWMLEMIPLQKEANAWRISKGLPEMPLTTTAQIGTTLMAYAGALLKGTFGGLPVTYTTRGAVSGLPWSRVYAPEQFWQELITGRGVAGAGAWYGTDYGIFFAAMSEPGHAAILKAIAANQPIPPEWQALYDYLRLSGQLPQMPGNTPSAAHTKALTLARQLNITLEEALAMIESGYVQTAGGLIASISLTPGQRAWFEFAAEQEAAGGGPGSEPASTWTPTRGTVPLIVGTGQYGMDQIITRPTRIRVLVGESGPEHVKITPLGRAEVERLIDRKMRAGRQSIDELEWNVSIAFSKRIMRGVAARG